MDEEQKMEREFPYSKEKGANTLLHSYAKVSFFANVFMTHSGNNVFNVHNIVYTWALISEQQSGLRISGSILKGWPLLEKDETSAREKTQCESCSKAQLSSDWINIY